MTPGSDLLQFVDSIASSPSVLLDLNNGSPLYIAGDGWSAPPPRLDRASSRSTGRDGTNIAQSSYSDRELVITLGLDVTSQDNAAAALQALGRLLNSDGQWLRWRPSTTAPVFFRTKRAEFDGIAEFNGQKDGFREITIRIPAEPFSYGLPVTGTATINNDPTHATNPMSYVFPAIQGDVATPLSIQVADQPRPLIAMCSSADAPSAPIISHNVVDNPAATGWGVSTTLADADAIGGQCIEFSKSSGTLQKSLTIRVPASPSGDYRMLIRAKGDGSMTFNARRSGSLVRVPFTPTGSTYRWFDIGVFGPRMPSQSPLSGVSVPVWPVTDIVVEATSPDAVDSARIDEILWVPAGIDSASFSSLLLSGATSGSAQNYDGISERAWASLGSGSYIQILYAGGMPSLVPDSKNVLTLVPGIGTTDVKTESRLLSYKYYPQYLYDRPATT